MKKSIPIFLILLFFRNSGHSQTCGNPAGTMGKGQWTTAVSGAYQTLDHDVQTFVSKRVFFKAAYGLAPWLDAYGLIGGTRVSIKNNSQVIADYKDRSRFAYGAGFTVLANPSPPKSAFSSRKSRRSVSKTRVGFWGGANVIRYPAEAVYTPSNTLLVHEYHWKYDCREVTGHAGIVVPYGMLKFYAGGIGWAIQRLDTKREIIMGGSSSQIEKSATGKYQSGLWTGGMAGIQLDLPQNYSLTVEAIGFNRSYYQIMIGVSQTGIRTW